MLSVTNCKQSVSSLFHLLTLLIYDTDCLQVVTTVTTVTNVIERKRNVREVKRS